MRTVIGLIIAVSLVSLLSAAEDEEENDPRKRQPSRCEVCKYLVTELKNRLDETGKNREILRLGHGLDEEKKRKISYKTSELRLTEALTEPHICNKILQYNVHAERKGSLRYAKGRSETMETLHGLVNKGVKVELGIPYELWDEPSAEVSIMQRNCFKMVEDYEDDIEDWYYNRQDEDLIKYLCTDRALKNDNQKCLAEVFRAKKESKEENEGADGKAHTGTKTKKKGDDGKEYDRAEDRARRDKTNDHSKNEKNPADIDENVTKDEEKDTIENTSNKDEL